MQTFLPYPSFARSARTLDRQRLGKQRVEALQILDALTVPGAGWTNHPATKMWRGYEQALVCYTDHMCAEWIQRGYDNTKCGEKLAEYINVFDPVCGEEEQPWWMGNRAFHMQHRRKLMWKDPDHYSQWFRIIPQSEEPHYLWPTEDKEFIRG